MRRDMPAYAFKLRQDVEIDAPEVAPLWKLPEPAPLRTRGPLIQTEAVSFAYSVVPQTDELQKGTVKSQSKDILRDVTLCIEQVITWISRRRKASHHGLFATAANCISALFQPLSSAHCKGSR